MALMSRSLRRGLPVRLFLLILVLQGFAYLVIVITSRYIETSQRNVPHDIHLNRGGRHDYDQHKRLKAKAAIKRPKHDSVAAAFSKWGINVSYVHIEPVIAVPSKMPELIESLKENTLPGMVQVFRNDNDTFSFEAPPPLVILTATDKDFLNITMNWRESIRQLGLPYRVLLMSEDDETYNFFLPQSSSRFQTVLSSKFSLPGNLARNISTYQHLIRRRTVYILTLLQSGHDVLLVDIDAVWFKDPVKYVLDQYNEHDIWIAQGYRARFPCPCFFYMKSTTLVIKMVYDWIERLAYLPGKAETDQLALSHILEQNKRGLRINFVDYFRFPIGSQFFNWTWHDQYADGVYIAHGNHLGRKDGKIATFQEFKVWLIGES
ncbi:uncharacterized protein [Diadema antillarum]